jgi:two-component system sensor histidine kinase AlgZ
MRTQPAATPDALLLPDLCTGTAVVAITVCAAALAFTFAQLPPLDAPMLLRAVRAFLFLLWAGLGSAALLCALRSVLARANYAIAFAIACFIPLLVVAAVSLAAVRLSALPQLALAQQFRVTSTAPQFLLHNIAVTALVLALLLPYFLIERRARSRADRQARAWLAIWQLPLQPLFLRQTLDILALRAATDPGPTLNDVQELAAWLSYSLRDEPPLIPLAQEIEHAQSFVRLAQLRLGQRLHVVWDLGDVPAALEVPHPLLSPLLAFAIEHGIEPRLQGGTVIIRGALEEGCLSLAIYLPLPEAGNEQPTQAVVEQLREALCERGSATLQLQAERRGDEYLLQLRLRGLSVAASPADPPLAPATAVAATEPRSPIL